MDVGFVGLGRMGAAMAANLAKAGHAVKLWNRTPGKAGPAILAGALEVHSVADAARGEAVITMLSEDAVVEEIAFGPGGIVETMRAGAIHVGMSTIGTGLAERLAEAHAERGSLYISAPVFGRPSAAEGAQLTSSRPGLHRRSRSSSRCSTPWGAAPSLSASAPRRPIWSSCAETS